MRVDNLLDVSRTFFEKVLAAHQELELDIATFLVEHVVRIVIQVHIVNNFVLNAQRICNFGKFAVHHVRTFFFVAVCNAKHYHRRFFIGNPDEFHLEIAAIAILVVHLEVALPRKSFTNALD